MGNLIARQLDIKRKKFRIVKCHKRKSKDRQGKSFQNKAKSIDVSSYEIILVDLDDTGICCQTKFVGLPLHIEENSNNLASCTVSCPEPLKNERIAVADTSTSRHITEVTDNQLKSTENDWEIPARESIWCSQRMSQLQNEESISRDSNQATQETKTGQIISQLQRSEEIPVQSSNKSTSPISHSVSELQDEDECFTGTSIKSIEEELIVQSTLQFQEREESCTQINNQNTEEIIIIQPLSLFQEKEGPSARTITQNTEEIIIIQLPSHFQNSEELTTQNSNRSAEEMLIIQLTSEFQDNEEIPTQVSNHNIEEMIVIQSSLHFEENEKFSSKVNNQHINDLAVSQFLSQLQGIQKFFTEISTHNAELMSLFHEEFYTHINNQSIHDMLVFQLSSQCEEQEELYVEVSNQTTLGKAASQFMSQLQENQELHTLFSSQSTQGTKLNELVSTQEDKLSTGICNQGTQKMQINQVISQAQENRKPSQESIQDYQLGNRAISSINEPTGNEIRADVEMGSKSPNSNSKEASAEYVNGTIKTCPNEEISDRMHCNETTFDTHQKFKTKKESLPFLPEPSFPKSSQFLRHALLKSNDQLTFTDYSSRPVTPSKNPGSSGSLDKEETITILPKITHNTNLIFNSFSDAECGRSNKRTRYNISNSNELSKSCRNRNNPIISHSTKPAKACMFDKTSDVSFTLSPKTKGASRDNVTPVIQSSFCPDTTSTNIPSILPPLQGHEDSNESLLIRTAKTRVPISHNKSEQLLLHATARDFDMQPKTKAIKDDKVSAPAIHCSTSEKVTNEYPQRGTKQHRNMSSQHCSYSDTKITSSFHRTQISLNNKHKIGESNRIRNIKDSKPLRALPKLRSYTGTVGEFQMCPHAHCSDVKQWVRDIVEPFHAIHATRKHILNSDPEILGKKMELRSKNARYKVDCDGPHTTAAEPDKITDDTFSIDDTLHLSH